MPTKKTKKTNKSVWILTGFYMKGSVVKMQPKAVLEAFRNSGVPYIQLPTRKMKVYKKKL